MIEDERLSAFLDGELPDTEMREIEAALDKDGDLRARLEALVAATAVGVEAFDAIAKEPVPRGLIEAIETAPELVVANVNAAPRFGWLAASVAALALLGVGGVSGYVVGLGDAPVVEVASRGWLDDIADYHRVYAAQGRHLVEVAASDQAHLETWLTATIGAEVRVPDLSAHGLTFEGGRLLVAASRPVAQLMYRDAQGSVVALCLIQSDTPNTEVASRVLGGFNLVTWGAADANYVLIGETDLDRMREIADAAIEA